MQLRQLHLPFLPRNWQRRQHVAVPLGVRRWKVVIPFRWIIGGLLAAILVPFLLSLLHAKLFTVKEVRVDGAVGVKPAVMTEVQVQQYAHKLLGQPLLVLQAHAIAQDLLKHFLPMQRVEVAIVYPSRVRITYVPRLAICQLVTPRGIYLVDRDGLLFAQLSQTYDKLPILSADPQNHVLLGQRISARGLMLGLALVQQLRGASPPLQQIQLTANELDVRFSGPPVVRVADDRDPVLVSAMLKSLFATFAQDKRYPAEVDLRYDRPVLRY